jgi:hypothetical protein
MQQPERWPLSPADSWLAWREHLNRFEGLHAETLKREAEAEMARILRCQAERPRPARLWCRSGLGAGVAVVTDGRIRQSSRRLA